MDYQPIVLDIYKIILQAYGSIVVAFHLEVLSGYRYLYFFKGRHGDKTSSMDMSKITYMHNEPNDHAGVDNVVQDSGHTYTSMNITQG